jgi:hypothetical protein
MLQINIQTRTSHWIGVLKESTDIPPALIPPVACILAQDDLYGLSARTPDQIEMMGKVVDAIHQLNLNYSPA